MGEANNNKIVDSEKSSNVPIDNEELLNNTNDKDSVDSINNKTKSTKKKSKKKKKKNQDISSDDIYEKIRNKRTIKARPKPKVVEEQEEKSAVDSEDVSLSNVEAEPEKTDLIITREIRFDDLSSDLKNKKNLLELTRAIEEFDKLDNYEEPVDKLVEEVELLPSVRYSNYKLKRNLLIFGIVVLSFILLFCLIKIFI